MISNRFVRLSRWVMPTMALLGMVAVAVLPLLANPGQAVAAAAPVVEWAQPFGGEHQDSGSFVLPTPDGGYVAAGGTGSSATTNFDAYLVKAGPGGNLVWQRTYGGSGSDWLVSVDVAQDGGYILGGITTSMDPGDLYLLKTDSDGILEWEQSYEGHSCIGARACSDGGYIIAGVLDDDVRLVKTYPDGDVEWAKSLGTDGYIYPASIEQAEDGGFVVVGHSKYEDIYLAKTDPDGDVDWQWLYAYGTKPMNLGTSVKQTDDGGYVVAGFTGDLGAFDMCLFKTEPDGRPSWGRVYGDTSCPEEAHSVTLTADGGYALAGSEYVDSTWQACLVKTDSSGGMTWYAVFGGAGRQILCQSVQETLDGGYVVAGVDQTKAGDDDLWLAKLGYPSLNHNPDQPGNSFPADGATGVSLTPGIQSTAFSDEDSGDAHAASQWQITATPGDYSAPVFDSGSDTADLTSMAVPPGTLSHGSTYCWRVRHQDSHGAWSAWSAETSLTTQLPVPALLSPADGALTRDNTPWLDWSDVTGPTGITYRLQVDDDPAFASPAVNKSGLTSSSRTISPALADGTFYWRVRSVDGGGGTSDWTDARPFSVDATSPSVPVLASQPNGKITRDNTPWLDWSDVTDAAGVKYQLQVDNDADFSSPVLSKTGMTTSSRTLGTLADGAYYWRVRAVDGAGNASAWAAPWSFTIDTVAPSVPTLSYPANGISTADTTPWLDWSDVTDATGVKYQLQVDNNADFSSPVVNKSGLTLSSRTLSTLADGTCYWRVRAVDGAGNTSAWATAWSFTVV